MTRIAGLTGKQAGPIMRLTQRISRRETHKFTKRATERSIEPLEVFTHAPRLLLGYLTHELAASKVNGVDHRLKELAVLKAATLAQCEYCIDIGSSVARAGGVSDKQLLALPRYRDSEQFNELEKLVLDYAVAMSRTPVAVSDEQFAALREHFDEPQLVELTHMIALENMRARFNAALDIGSAGFTEGMVCALPDTITAAQAPPLATAQAPAMPARAMPAAEAPVGA